VKARVVKARGGGGKGPSPAMQKAAADKAQQQAPQPAAAAAASAPASAVAPLAVSGPGGFQPTDFLQDMMSGMDEMGGAAAGMGLDDLMGAIGAPGDDVTGDAFGGGAFGGGGDAFSNAATAAQVEAATAADAAGAFVPSAYLQDIMSVVETQTAAQPWLLMTEFDTAGGDGSAAPTGGGARAADSGGGGGGDGGGGGGASVAAPAVAPTADDIALRNRALEHAASAALKEDWQRRVKGSQYKKLLARRKELPTYKMKDELVSLVRHNQVVVVSGETGCGKTTQLPQLVLEDAVMRGEGARCNCVCTQPRRISAMGVAERIAQERHSTLGDEVGYQIRLESKCSAATRLLFCTTGILLRRLQCDSLLEGVSHVFVDEVHERDLNTDFLLIILRQLLPKRPNLKLILMSATLNASMFAEYFGGASNNAAAIHSGAGGGAFVVPVPMVEIEGRAHPVTQVPPTHSTAL
jgi:HrpA-like RNA helicase